MYIESNKVKNTYRCYSMVMDKFCEEFSDYQLGELTVDTILDFLNQIRVMFPSCFLHSKEAPFPYRDN
jgi:hypothetical protein